MEGSYERKCSERKKETPSTQDMRGSMKGDRLGLMGFTGDAEAKAGI